MLNHCLFEDRDVAQESKGTIFDELISQHEEAQEEALGEDI